MQIEPHHTLGESTNSMHEHQEHIVILVLPERPLDSSWSRDNVMDSPFSIIVTDTGIFYDIDSSMYCAPFDMQIICAMVAATLLLQWL